MFPELFAIFVDATIPIVAGIYATLLGHRRIGKKPGENFKADAWHQQFGTFFKIFGPLMILFGISRIIIGLAELA